MILLVFFVFFRLVSLCRSIAALRRQLFIDAENSSAICSVSLRRQVGTSGSIARSSSVHASLSRAVVAIGGCVLGFEVRMSAYSRRNVISVLAEPWVVFARLEIFWLACLKVY